MHLGEDPKEFTTRSGVSNAFEINLEEHGNPYADITLALNQISISVWINPLNGSRDFDIVTKEGSFGIGVVKADFAANFGFLTVQNLYSSHGLPVPGQRLHHRFLRGSGPTSQ